MRLTLIRHTSVAVPKGVCYGQSDVALAGSFDSEAEVVCGRLKGRRFDEVYSSPLSRCVKLAARCGYENPKLDPRLMEMNFGEWEMKRYDEITDPRIELWYADFLNVRATGGESSMDQRERFLDFVNDIRASGYGSVAVFTHGGIMIHALATLCGLTDEEAFARQPGYDEILEIEI